jgi:hypothetical protein
MAIMQTTRKSRDFPSDQNSRRVPYPDGGYRTEVRRASQFWFESLQNWQSEFFSIGYDGVLRIPYASRGVMLVPLSIDGFKALVDPVLT